MITRENSLSRSARGRDLLHEDTKFSIPAISRKNEAEDKVNLIQLPIGMQRRVSVSGKRDRAMDESDLSLSKSVRNSVYGSRKESARDVTRFTQVNDDFDNHNPFLSGAVNRSTEYKKQPLDVSFSEVLDIVPCQDHTEIFKRVESLYVLIKVAEPRTAPVIPVVVKEEKESPELRITKNRISINVSPLHNHRPVEGRSMKAIHEMCSYVKYHRPIDYIEIYRMEFHEYTVLKSQKNTMTSHKSSSIRIQKGRESPSKSRGIIQKHSRDSSKASVMGTPAQSEKESTFSKNLEHSGISKSFTQEQLSKSHANPSISASKEASRVLLQPKKTDSKLGSRPPTQKVLSAKPKSDKSTKSHPYRIEPGFQIDDVFKTEPVKSDRLYKDIPIRNESIKLNSELSDRNSVSRISRHSNLLNFTKNDVSEVPVMEKQVKSVGLDTVDLKPDSLGNISQDISQDLNSSSQKKTITHMVIPNAAELLETMNQNRDLRGSMRMSFQNLNHTKPVAPVGRSFEPDIPNFSRSLRSSKMGSLVSSHKSSHKNEKELPIATYEKTNEKLKDDTFLNNSDVSSQKTRSFRIKENNKKSSAHSRDPSQSGVHPDIISGRRNSQSLSEVSDKTKKGTKNSLRSNTSVELSEREQLLNQQVKKCEPYIIKYMEASKWSNEKDRLRAVVAEGLKKASPLFSAFSIEFVDFLIKNGSFSLQPKDTMLFTEGEQTDKMALVMFGVVQHNCKKGLVSLTHGGVICEECIFTREPVTVQPTEVMSKTLLLWLGKDILKELKEFCEASRRKNEYILFVAHLQKQNKLKS